MSFSGSGESGIFGEDESRLDFGSGDASTRSTRSVFSAGNLDMSAISVGRLSIGLGPASVAGKKAMRFPSVWCVVGSGCPISTGWAPMSANQLR